MRRLLGEGQARAIEPDSNPHSSSSQILWLFLHKKVHFIALVRKKNPGSSERTSERLSLGEWPSF